jgi:predicted Ser/Thr protein kinase
MSLAERLSKYSFNQIDEALPFDIDPLLLTGAVWMRTYTISEEDFLLYVFSTRDDFTVLATSPSIKAHPSRYSKVAEFLNKINSKNDFKTVMLKHHREPTGQFAAMVTQNLRLSQSVLSKVVNVLLSSFSNIAKTLRKFKVFEPSREKRFTVEQIDIILQTSLQSIGLNTFSKATTPRTCEYYMTINDTGISSEDSWRQIQLLVYLSSSAIMFRTSFIINSKKPFFDREKLEVVLRFLNKVNANLSFGRFLLMDNQFIVLESKFLYSRLEHEDEVKGAFRPNLIQHLSNYKRFAYGLAKLIEPADHSPDTVYEQCEKRMKDIEDRRKSSAEKQKKTYTLPDKPETLKNVEIDEEYLRAYEETQDRDLELVEKVYKPGADIEADRAMCMIEGIRDLVCPVVSLKNEVLTFSIKGMTSFYMAVVTQPDQFEHKRAIFFAFAQDLYQRGIMFRPDAGLGEGVYFSCESIALSPFEVTKTVALETREFEAYTEELMRSLNLLLMKVMKYQCVQLKHYTSLTLSHKIDVMSFSNPDLDDSTSLIGRGGFGEIYRNSLYGMEVALKTLRSDKDRESEGLVKEYEMLTQLNHENLIQVYGMSEHKQRNYIVMEICTNDSLNKFVRQYNINITTKLKILCKVSRAVAFIHSKKIVHLDIKPHNILLTKDLVPKLCDFGLAMKEKQAETRKAGFTLHYAAPEHLLGKSIGLKADIWGMGMTIYAVVFEKSPFWDRDTRLSGRESKSDMLDYLVTKQKRPTIPNEFERDNQELTGLMRECWSLNKAERPEAQKLSKELQRLYLEYKRSSHS